MGDRGEATKGDYGVPRDGVPVGIVLGRPRTNHRKAGGTPSASRKATTPGTKMSACAQASQGARHDDS